MSRHEAPAYFLVTDDTDGEPDPESCTEGRLFLNEERLVCGAGDPAMQEGYVGRIDDHAGSTVRRLFGGVKGFQEFDATDATGRERTRSLSLDAVTGVDTVEWAGSDLRGADRTYGVRVDARELAGRSLLVQLGRGWRNRGSGRKRHAALARAIGAMAGDVGAAGSDDSPTTEPGDVGSSTGTTATAERTADADEQPSWLADESDGTVLVARNDTERTASARVGCRTDEGPRFVDDVTLASGGRKRWTDLPESRPFEIGVVPEHGDSTVAEFDGAEGVEGDIHVYLTSDEAVIDTSTATASTGVATGERVDTTADASAGATVDSDEAGTTAADATDSGGSRLKSLGIAFLGLVVWFGSALLQPSVILPGRGIPYGADPSVVEMLTLSQTVVAFVGVGILIYGLYTLVRGGK